MKKRYGAPDGMFQKERGNYFAGECPYTELLEVSIGLWSNSLVGTRYLRIPPE